MRRSQAKDSTQLGVGLELLNDRVSEVRKSCGGGSSGCNLDRRANMQGL
jgi:hypothetical protein